VIVPAREDVAVFAATLKVTVPLADPVAPAVTVIQPTLLTAVQLHPLPAVTLIVPLPPLDGTDCEAGEIAYVQVGAAPACVTV
jgi:hypothetical protein